MDDIYYLQRALQYLIQARTYVRDAGARNSYKRIERAINSTRGALAHAQRAMREQEMK